MSCYNPKPINKIWDEATKKWKINFLKKIDKNTQNLFWETMEYLPCGKCIGCKLKHAKEWGIRISNEIETTNTNECWFVTFTYNNENLPTNEKNEATLKPNDMKKFINSLRKKHERKGNKNIKYFGSGEYGKNFTKRPHYHYLFFNLPINDIKAIGKNNLGQTYYKSEEINKLWGKGNCLIGKGETEAGNYIARYTTKKEWGTKDDKHEIKEFLRMSTRPAIGKKYYDENKEKIYTYDKITLKTLKGTIQTKPPRYYDKLREKDNKNEMIQIKQERQQNCINKLKNELKQTELKYTDYLGNKQKILIQKTKCLKRKK